VKRTRVPLISHDSAASPDALQLTSATAVADAFRVVVGDPPREHFLSFYLDAANRIMGYETIAIGGCASVEVEPAQVFREPCWPVLSASSSRTTTRPVIQRLRDPTSR